MTVETLPPARRPLPPVYPAMSGRPAGTVVTPGRSSQRLSRGQVFTIPCQSGIRSVEIISGNVWLTATPADQDILLHTGDQFLFGSHAPYVLEALTDTEFILHR